MTAPTRRQRADVTRRFPALVVVIAAVAAVVAGGLAVDGRTGVAPAAAEATAADLAPVAPAADALGSTWYCAAGTGTADGTADHVVTIANVGAEPVDVVLTVVPGADLGADPDAEPEVEELTVDPRSREEVDLRDVVEAPYVSAVVEAGRGEVVVEHAIATGGTDFDAAPCASSSSPSWYVAASTTTRDAQAQLVLFNPFPDDAVVDVTFVTPEGKRAPSAFAGLIVPGRRTTVVDVGEIVSRHANVSISVVARAGRLVVERVQRFDGTDGPAGTSVTPAAPEPAPVWHFPDGLVADGIGEIVTVYNPTDQPAEVDVEVHLDPTSDLSQPVAAEPFSQTVAPHGFARIDVGNDGQPPPTGDTTTTSTTAPAGDGTTEDAAPIGRVPLGRGHSITVRSQNGVPVVAERWIRSASPAARTGFSATLGSPVLATRWLAGIGGATADVAEYLVLLNPAAEGIARVSVTAATPAQELAIAGLEDVEVPAQGRVAIDLGQYLNRDDLVLVIESSTPIVAERGLYPVSAGLAASILVPSAPTATLAEVDPASVLGG